MAIEKLKLIVKNDDKIIKEYEEDSKIKTDVVEVDTDKEISHDELYKECLKEGAKLAKKGKENLATEKERIKQLVKNYSKNREKITKEFPKILRKLFKKYLNLENI